MITLVTGGARSGKSLHAETLAARLGGEVTYIATAAVLDVEMADRIARHRARRPREWHSVEEPLALGAALRACAGDRRCVLIDCLTLWLTNLLALDLSAAAQARENFLAALECARGEVIVVTNEIGLGVVPLGELSRRFVDDMGRLNQAVAERADRVILMIAGCPLRVKGE